VPFHLLSVIQGHEPVESCQLKDGIKDNPGSSVIAHRPFQHIELQTSLTIHES
jgi:hypothetical protein